MKKTLITTFLVSMVLLATNLQTEAAIWDRFKKVDYVAEEQLLTNYMLMSVKSVQIAEVFDVEQEYNAEQIAEVFDVEQEYNAEQIAEVFDVEQEYNSEQIANMQDINLNYFSAAYDLEDDFE